MGGSGPSTSVSVGNEFREGLESMERECALVSFTVSSLGSTTIMGQCSSLSRKAPSNPSNGQRAQRNGDRQPPPQVSHPTFDLWPPLLSSVMLFIFILPLPRLHRRRSLMYYAIVARNYDLHVTRSLKGFACAPLAIFPQFGDVPSKQQNEEKEIRL
jgi:hypothetical protein